MGINIIYNQTGRDKLYKTWHTPASNMIIYIKNGKGSIVLQNGVYEMKAGVLCFIASNSRHYTLPQDPERYVRHKVFFDDAFLKSGGKVVGCDDIVVSAVVYACVPKSAEGDIESIYRRLECSTSDAQRRACVLQLLAFVDEYTKTGSTEKYGFTASVVNYINSHIHEAITIDELCEQVHMSKYHFCRKFKAKTGFTVMDYLLKTRIALACDLIEKSDFSIGEISDRCGFCSVSYFCRVFKENIGMSPLKYKKKNEQV